MSTLPLILVVALNVLMGAACALAQDAQRPESDEVKKLLSETLIPGTYKAQPLQMRMPRDATEIMLRMTQAIAADPEWIQAYVAENSDLKPGDPLPYHTKLGITAKEYERLVAAMSETKLVPIGDCRFQVERTAQGKLRLTGSGAASVLNGVEVDPESMIVEYAGLASNDCKVIRPKATALVSVTGVAWNTEKGELPQNCSALSMTVGYQSKELGFIEFRATEVVDGTPRVAKQLYLQWTRSE